MNVTKIVSMMPFKGKIIDAHAHIGRWDKSDLENGKWVKRKDPYQYTAQDLDYFIKEPLDVAVQNKKEQDTVEKAIVSNLDCIYQVNPKDEPIRFAANELDGNRDMLKIAETEPKIAPLAVCQPGYGSVDNIRQLFEENPDKFAGLKFHPKCLNIPANDKSYEPYLEFAQKKGLPCLFHSEVNVGWEGGEGKVVEDSSQREASDPRFIYELAKKYKDVPVILGHTGAGGVLAHQEAIKVLLDSIKNGDANLYTDVSWVDFTSDGKPSKNPNTVIQLIKDLKEQSALERVLFGTDAAVGCYGETAKDKTEAKANYEKTISCLKTAIKNDKDLADDADDIIDKIFYKNAEKLFFENKPPHVRE